MAIKKDEEKDRTTQKGSKAVKIYITFPYTVNFYHFKGIVETMNMT